MSVVKRAFSALGKLGIIIAIAIAFIIGMVGTVYLSLRSPEVKVPDVVGKDVMEGEQALDKDGLNMRRRATRFSPDAKPNTILAQEPHAGEIIKVGQTVAVVVSRATAKEGESPITAEENFGNDNKNANAESNTSKNENENANKSNRNTRSKNTNNSNNSNNANNSNNRNANNRGNSNNSNNRNANDRNANNRNTNANRPANSNAGNTNGNRNTLNINRNTNANRRAPATTPASPNGNRRTP